MECRNLKNKMGNYGWVQICNFDNLLVSLPKILILEFKNIFPPKKPDEGVIQKVTGDNFGRIVLQNEIIDPFLPLSEDK